MAFSVGGSDRCGLGFGDLGLQPLTSQGAPTTNTLIVRATSTLDRDPSDESFGVDNVRVMIR
jgi:hypothetical protein